MSSEGHGEKAHFSATPLQMYVLFYLNHLESNQIRQERSLNGENLPTNIPIISRSVRELIKSVSSSKPLKKAPTTPDEFYNQLISLEEHGLLTQKKEADMLSSSFSITEQGILNVRLYLDGLTHAVEDAVQSYTPSYSIDIAVLFINLIEKVREVQYVIEKLTSPTEHSKVDSVNFHIGDYIMGDKAGGDIAGRDLMKAGGDIIINQDQIHELKDIITELRRVQGEPELAKQRKEELEAEIQTIESQINSPKPKTTIIKHALSSAKDIVKDVSNAVVAAAPLISKITLWLNGV